MAGIFGLLATAGVFYPYLALATGWLSVGLIERLWMQAVTREREHSGAHFFCYRFWARYGGWAVFSGFFFLLLPLVSPTPSSWWQFQVDTLHQPLWSLIGFTLLSVLLFGWLVVIPTWGLVAALTACDIGLLVSGLRLVPLPAWPARDLEWSEIQRFVVREPRRGSRRDPISYYIYLRDGSYVPLYARMMGNTDALIAAIESHTSVEREVWPRW